MSCVFLKKSFSGQTSAGQPLGFIGYSSGGVNMVYGVTVKAEETATSWTCLQQPRLSAQPTIAEGACNCNLIEVALPDKPW